MKRLIGLSLRLLLWLVGCASFTLPVHAITFTTDTAISFNDTNYDGVDIVVTNCTLTVDGPHSFASLQVLNGGTLTHTHDPSGNLPSNSIPTGLDLTIAGDALIEPGGAFNVNAQGYGAGFGPGAGISQGSPASGAGAGHGGYGGLGTSNSVGGGVYGSIREPIDKGSGGGGGTGGAGGRGGGAIKLVVGGALRINGSITASGANATSSRAGGGSGGSVWLSAQTVSGTGSISANGGAGEPIHGGGGGGGRIAIYFVTNSFAGSIAARGGPGFIAGGAGTIFSKAANQPAGQVLVENGSQSGANTLLSAAKGIDLTLRDGAKMVAVSAQSIRNLHIASNAWFIVTNQALTITGSATIDSGGGIVADGTGSPGGQGPGAGGFASSRDYGTVGGGGGYGGLGGTSVGGARGGSAYGNSISAPTFPGSGGGNTTSQLAAGGGFGGGALRIAVSGTLQLEGRISANGQDALRLNCGGGSGGSVWVSAGRLIGSGSIAANGGAGNNFGGGGAGGRIALTDGTNLFSGKLSAFGALGGGGIWGGAGTIYRRANNTQFESLLIDNGNRDGATPLALEFAGDLNITGRATVLNSLASRNLNNLFIASNSFLFATNMTVLSLTINSNATIQSGAALSVDGMGFPSGSGTGAGRISSSTPFGTTGSGAGYGGAGGNSAGGALGGSAYGSSISQQLDRGSGGGAVTTGAAGAGGGALRLNVARTLQVDGTISANGQNAAGLNSGGGSGGSLSLTAGTFIGSGRIAANGGAGNGYGGGGGGGRIAIGYGTNHFSGAVTAYGGCGNACGGAGTIYLKVSNQPVAQVFVDNGGRAGTNTVFSDSGIFDFTVQGGGVLFRSGATHSFRNLLIGSNSWVLLTNQFMMATNVTVETGGGIVADGAGYGPGQGEGAGRNSQTQTGSGGGHGGYGASSGTAAGGNGYGFAALATSTGSGGGSSTGSSFNPGGAGGGMVRLSVLAKLHLDGRISADGRDAPGFNAGGGSGGSIWVSVGELSGSGLISANGGAGNGSGGGGGGGGRIAVYYRSNSFTGTMRAFGGASGATNASRFGGAGTIYLATNTQQEPALVLTDNGGRLGTNTLLLDRSYLDLTIQGGAALVPAESSSIRNLLIASNSWLVLSSQTVSLLRGNAIVQAGGGITADRTGFPGGQGPGAGSNRFSSIYGYTGGGGGHGGLGAPSDGDAAGGKAYGVALFPFTDSGGFAGSGGGGNPANSAGAGGGLVRFSATSLILDGRISADGGDGVNQHGGGGSGGSISLNVGTLSGSGLISANGGDGNGVGGGGGGGRIATTLATNQFTGTLRAFGGLGGDGAGGAGTIYLKTNGGLTARVFVDNGGWPGMETPLENVSNVGLDVKGVAAVRPLASYLALNDLLVDSFGSVVSAPGLTNLDLIVYGNAVIASGGAISVDGQGYAQAQGPGAGLSVAGFGSGAGYGGTGGASVTTSGGRTYGSFVQPVERGSGGGFGSGPLYGGSAGGGAIRLNVGGTLTVNGRLSANGNAGLQDNSGGGSGGSLWVTTGLFTGQGHVNADGGAGEWFGGGGGAGGRVSVHYRTSSPTNRFTGLLSAYGGEGAFWGEDGSVFLASGIAPLQVISQIPRGVVSNSINRVEVVFSAPVKPGSFSGEDFVVQTPTRTLFDTNRTVLNLAPSHFQILLPALTEVGDYTIRIGPAVEDLYGQPMSQVYTGAFTVALPAIEGTITDASGLPVPGVLLQPGGVLSSTVTDSDGRYALGFVPGSSFNVAPAKPGVMFVPSSLSYGNVTMTLTNQDFLAVDTIAPPIQTEVLGTSFVLGWHGYSGVRYQLLYSTNLVNWLSYGSVVSGSNTFIEVPVLVAREPMQFFRVRANN